ncbi:MAG: ACP S-malonyltransferase, partial [Clostridiales bacterium]|nr:ACP S-malonyltransferase [Clostridiales bacterium]
MAEIAFVFSGQGAQYPGMGRELYECSPAAKMLFEAAGRIRPGTSRQCFEGTKEELSQTVNTQPCVFTVSLAAAAALKERGVIPQALAGFSLGELSALAFARVLPLSKAFGLVCRRAREMQACAEERESAMAAVIGLKDKVVEEACREFAGVFPVNYNCPGQIVLAGEKEGLALACAAIKKLGGAVRPLAVNAAFHTPLMAGAA